MRIATKAVLALGVGGALAASLAGTALANPPSGVTPTATSIVGVGSDTTQNVLNQLSTDYNKQSPAPTNKLYSYDAFGTPATIATKAGCAAITRPAGSGAGITALKQNTRPSGNTTNFCIDFARSSRGPQAADTGLAFIRYAQDAVTWSATSSSSAPTNAPASLSNTELRAIYTCNAGLVGGTANSPVRWNQVGGTSTDLVAPVLPQASSGTRSFFLGAIGVTTVGSCVQQPSGLEENQGTTPSTLFGGSNAKNLVFPYSVAVYLAQSQNGKGTGNQGKQILGSSENGSTVIAPTTGATGSKTINPQLATVSLTRFVYNVVRDPGSSTSGVPTYLQAIFGNGNNTGYVCTNATAKADIQAYGFRLIGTSCGTVSRP